MKQCVCVDAEWSQCGASSGSHGELHPARSYRVGTEGPCEKPQLSRSGLIFCSAWCSDGNWFTSDAFYVSSGKWRESLLRLVVWICTFWNAEWPLSSLSFLQDGFSTLLPLDGWGNARDVDKVWRASLQERADRVVQNPEGGICSLNVCFFGQRVSPTIFCHGSNRLSSDKRQDVQVWRRPFKSAMSSRR